MIRVSIAALAVMFAAANVTSGRTGCGLVIVTVALLAIGFVRQVG